MDLGDEAGVSVQECATKSHQPDGMNSAAGSPALCVPSSPRCRPLGKKRPAVEMRVLSLWTLMGVLCTYRLPKKPKV